MRFVLLNEWHFYVCVICLYTTPLQSRQIDGRRHTPGMPAVVTVCYCNPVYTKRRQAAL